MNKNEDFPMLDGPSIKIETAKKIYEVYSYLYSNDQTIERIAERGGFGWGEVASMWKKAIKKGYIKQEKK